MILQIAAGVCLGMVAAFAILKNREKLIAALGSIVSLVLGIGLLVVIGWGIWTAANNIPWRQVLIWGSAMAAIMVMCGIPLLIYGVVAHRYPAFNTLIKGKQPWNQLKRLPVRLIVVAGFSICVAVAGVGALLGTMWLLSKVGIIT